MIEKRLVVLKKKSLMELIGEKFLICVIIFAIFIVSLCGIIIVKKIIHPDKIPDILKYKPLIVLTGSMEPTINIGDIIIIKEIDFSKLSQGDIIAFRYKGEETAILHRIASRNDTHLRTKGDNNSSEDMQDVTASEVEGIYCYRIPIVGNIAMAIRTPLGLACSLLSVIVIFCIWQVIKMNKLEKLLTKRLKEYEEIIEILEEQKNEENY